jgi:ubiquinone/menaquinone biosynthesis C-methylase UbiE
MPNYALDNASPHGAGHLTGLAGLFDHFTTARIADTTQLKGARCLELGAGIGSVATWLAEEVGPDGHVTATDLDVRHIPAHERLSILKHDLLEEPVPVGPFDLVHARCLLSHLPNRDELLPTLCERLAPGGTIVVEDFANIGTSRALSVLHAPEARLFGLWRSYEQKRSEYFSASGTDHAFIARVHGLLLDAGLDNVRTVSYAESWRGGEAGSRHALSTLEQFRPRLVQDGFTSASVDALVTALNNPEFHVAGRALTSTSATKPL